MKRLGFLAALAMLTMLILAPTALAQDSDLDCSDFATQQEAQAVFNQDTSDPNGLDADGDMVACESLPDGTMEDGTTNGNGTAIDNGADTADLDCADFASQQAAQANLDANPSDPNGLDADGDDLACEEYPYPGLTPLPEGSPPLAPGVTLADVQGELQQPVEQQTPFATDGTQMQEMPDTGGPGLLAPGTLAALLVGSGALGLAWTRRRNS